MDNFFFRRRQHAYRIYVPFLLNNGKTVQDGIFELNERILQQQQVAQKSDSKLRQRNTIKSLLHSN